MTVSEGVGFFILYVCVILGMLLLLKMLMKVARINMVPKWKQRATDDFRSQNGHSWDYVFVFNVFDSSDLLTNFQKKNSVRKIVEKVTRAGLETKMFFSVQRDEVRRAAVTTGRHRPQRSPPPPPTPPRGPPVRPPVAILAPTAASELGCRPVLSPSVASVRPHRSEEELIVSPGRSPHAHRQTPSGFVAAGICGEAGLAARVPNPRLKTVSHHFCRAAARRVGTIAPAAPPPHPPPARAARGAARGGYRCSSRSAARSSG